MNYSAACFLFTLLLSAPLAVADCMDDASLAVADGEFYRALGVLDQCPRRKLDSKRALEIFDAIEKKGNEPGAKARALLASGKILERQRQSDESLQRYTRAVETDPELADAYFARGRLLDRNGDEEAALADYSRTVELDPQNADAFYYRARIYRKRDLDHLAIEDYARAVELEPRHIRAEAGRAMTFLFPLFPVLLVLLLG